MSHVERMRRLTGWASLGHDPRLARRYEVNRFDLGVNAEVNRRFKIAYANWFAQCETGCGFPVDEAIREFTLEYSARIWDHGLGSEPSSFNVMEAWFDYDPALNFYSLRPQRDHIFTLHPLLTYAAERQGAGDNPFEAAKKFEEDVIYNFNSFNVPEELTITSGDAEFALGGISLIRRGDELNFMALIGERCDIDRKTAEHRLVAMATPTFSRPEIQAAPELEARAVPFLGSSQFHKQLLLARVDLRTGLVLVRYALSDFGNAFVAIMDDWDILRIFDKQRREAIVKSLAVYEPVFLAARQLLFLPAYFADHAKLVERERHPTRLGKRTELSSKRALKHAEQHCKVRHRTIEVLDEAVCLSHATGATFQIPAFEIATEGHWEDLPHGQLGRDKFGKPIHGKTWIRTVREHAVPQRSLLLSSFEKELWFERNQASLPNAGWIYIVRSPSHREGVFKIGLTTVSPQDRAKQLSQATGVPDEFALMWSWLVTDCRAAEAEIHRQLAPYRFNKQREFFQAPMPTIDAVVRDVCRTYDLARPST